MQALTPQADLSHALTQAFEQQRRALYAQALAILAEPAAAEDAVQEAFVRVWRRRERLDDPGRLAGYLATAVRHLAFDLRRRAQVRADARILVARESAAAPAEGVADAERLDAALRGLPAEQREVILLRVHAGLSFAEVAARTDAPLGTVHSRYRYGMTRLRRALTDPRQEASDA